MLFGFVLILSRQPHSSVSNRSLVCLEAFVKVSSIRFNGIMKDNSSAAVDGGGTTSGILMLRG